jgi:hypothetical protein
MIGRGSCSTALTAASVAWCLTISASAQAQLVVSGGSAAQLAQQLAGPGVSIVGTPTYVGASEAAGRFSGGAGVVANFPSSGVVLSSGRVADNVASDLYGVEGPNDRQNTSNEWSGAGDTDLNALLGTTTADAAALEFTFRCPANATALRVQVVFGSEEYEDDGFAAPEEGAAIFLDGANIATLPNGEPISTLSINGFDGLPVCGAAGNQTCFRNNSLGSCYEDEPPTCPYGIEANGFSVTLSAQRPITGGANHSLKLVVADDADPAFDSWLFVSALECVTVAAPAVPALGAPAALWLASGLAGLAAFTLRRARSRKRPPRGSAQSKR